MKKNKTAPTTAIANGDVMDYATYQAALAEVYSTAVPLGYATCEELRPPAMSPRSSSFRERLRRWCSSGKVRRINLPGRVAVYHIGDTLREIRAYRAGQPCPPRH